MNSGQLFGVLVFGKLISKQLEIKMTEESDVAQQERVSSSV